MYSTHETQEADAVGAGATAAEEADDDDEAADGDHDEGDPVEHDHRVGRIVP